MPSKVTVNWLDYSGESSRSSVYVPTVNAGNFDAIVALATLVGTTFETLSDCTRKNTQLEMIQDAANDAVPSDVFAQREIGFSVQYMDATTGRKETTRIPGPVDDLIPEGTDVLPLANLAFAALIADIEANCVSRDGNAITVTRGVFTGRNN